MKLLEIVLKCTRQLRITKKLISSGEIPSLGAFTIKYIKNLFNNKLCCEIEVFTLISKLINKICVMGETSRVISGKV